MTFRSNSNCAIFLHSMDNGDQTHNTTSPLFECHIFGQSDWFWNTEHFYIINFYIWKNLKRRFLYLKANVPKSVWKIVNRIQNLRVSCKAYLQRFKQYFRKWNLLRENLIVQWIAGRWYWRSDQMSQFPTLHRIRIAVLLCHLPIVLTHFYFQLKLF